MGDRVKVLVNKREQLSTIISGFIHRFSMEK
jgi:hypothetical protein